MLTNHQIINALRAFAEQRPGIEPENYGSWRDYRNESASVTRDLHDARALLRYCELMNISAEHLLAGFRAFSGRLSISETDKGEARLDYCTGQYFPTEFRKAVAAVCASALWDWYRDDCLPQGTENAGNKLRGYFKREFGHRLASRYFD